MSASANFAFLALVRWIPSPLAIGIYLLCFIGVVGSSGSEKHFCESVITHYDTFILRLQSTVGSPRGYAASAEASADFVVCTRYPNRKNRRGRLFTRNGVLLISPSHLTERILKILSAIHLQICGFFDGDGSCVGVCVSQCFTLSAIYRSVARSCHSSQGEVVQR